MLESIPEAKRWDPVPGSTGRQLPESPSEDEDDEGRAKVSSSSTRVPRKPGAIACSKPPRQPRKRTDVNREFFDHTYINGAGTFGIGQRYLAGDESSPTIGKRFAHLNIPATATEGNRRAYREQLFTSPGEPS